MTQLETVYVPYQEAESEFVEKRSRFIGHVWPVDSEGQAQELLRRVRKQHYDARHNCWCYLLGGSVVRYSDDGEPQGTAGQPMLAVFQREHVTNLLCVSPQYFSFCRILRMREMVHSGESSKHLTPCCFSSSLIIRRLAPVR